LRQACSDLLIARNLDDSDQLLSRDRRCHIAAMCQQAIEKSVKSLYIALGMMPKRTHQIAGFIIEMTAVIKTAGSVRRELTSLFSHSARQIIRELSGLVPKSAQEDPNQTSRNSEYPFLSSGTWIAPADEPVFRQADIVRFLRETGRIVDGVTRIRATVHRMS
jgi:hypothetical protein